MEKYRIERIRPDNYIHVAAFDELHQGIAAALHDLERHGDDRRIVLGAHLAPEANYDIIVQTEVAGSSWFTPEYISCLQRAAEVWDYSLSNIQSLLARDVHVKLLRIGYHPRLDRIKFAETRDIDVLFFGSLTSRRAEILEAIDKRLNVVHLFGIYGSARDAFVARSKIVLNLHAYDNSPFETVRCSYLAANGAFILSEGKKASDVPIGAYAPLHDIPSEILYWLAHHDTRQLVARLTHEKFKKTSQAELLLPLLSQ